MSKSLFISFVDTNTGKLSPVTPVDNGVVYRDGGFIADYGVYKTVNKGLPWDTIDPIINQGMTWQGSPYGKCELVIKLN